MERGRSSLAGRLLLFVLLPIAALAGGLAVRWMATPGPSDGDVAAFSADHIALGKRIYAQHCATCHGRNLEGQPNWQSRKADGKLPAPPHDATGHTWHHDDRVLFRMVKFGTASMAPPGYRTDMPAYHGVLSDNEIDAVLTFIKSRWPARLRRHQASLSH